MNKLKLNNNFSIEKARKTQLHLSKQIIFEDSLPRKIRYVAGVDVAYKNDFAIGVVAVLDYATLSFVESQIAISKIYFPYIPTLLSFREVPPSFLCIGKLKMKPDVFLVDGHGFAHPYYCGFASHLGIVLKKPTIGVAKNKLIGELKDFNDEGFAYLVHNDQIIGAALKTTSGGKLVYVSVGHMISFETAVKIVKHCTRKSKIPEPLRKAHQIATKARSQIKPLT